MLKHSMTAGKGAPVAPLDATRRTGRQAWLTIAPGWVRTDMGGPAATLSIEESIPAIADLLERRHGSATTAYVNYEGRELPW